MTKVWILTREENEYDQSGAYFEAAFEKQPSIQQLADYFNGKPGMPGTIMGAVAFLENLRQGGGRMAKENTWYNLEQVDLR